MMKKFDMSNFSRIDDMIKNEDVANGKGMMVLYSITKIINSEISKLINNADIFDGDFPISSIESITMHINKNDKGFVNLNLGTTDPTLFLNMFEKGKKCLLNDEDITDEISYWNTFEDEQREFINSFHNAIKEETQQIISNKTKNTLEKDIENILIKDLNVIEEGMTVIQSQYPVNSGYIDILVRDKNNKLCIIELKKVNNDSKIIQQCVYYPTQFNEEVRMITITPGYTNKIFTSLKSLGYVEMMQYDLEGDQIEVFTYNKKKS